jgi:hypothetical protein
LLEEAAQHHKRRHHAIEILEAPWVERKHEKAKEREQEEVK